MINSTRCPLCSNGIGHQMDDRHAQMVAELIGWVKTYRSTLKILQNSAHLEMMDKPYIERKLRGVRTIINNIENGAR
jgi:hypothetical protein